LSCSAEARSWPNGFSTTTRAPSAQRAARGLQRLDDGGEQRRRDRQVVQRALRVAELALERREGLRVGVVAVDVAQQREQLVVGVVVLGDRVVRALLEVVEIPTGLGDADDRHLEDAAADQRVQGGEDLLVREVSRRAEEDEGVAVVAHDRGEPRRATGAMGRKSRVRAPFCAESSRNRHNLV
jgi:hypothetical protein